MRDIVEIIEDFKKGKELSSTERPITLAYIQGKYDAARELKTNPTDIEVLDKLRVDIMDWQTDIHDNEYDSNKHDFVFERIYEILDEYKNKRNINIYEVQE